MANTRPRGSAFKTSDQGIFYNLLDFAPSAVTDSGATNRTSIISALTSMAANGGGGVLLVPHGVTHTFNPAVDFPATSNKLLVWELQGDKFSLYGNQSVGSNVGDIVEQAKFTNPQVISLRLVDAFAPVAYEFKLEVYDNPGSPVISGSSYDVCVFLPGGVTPVEAIARSGATPGRHFFFQGIDSTHVETDTLTVSTSITGVKKFNLEVVTPAAAGTTNLADSTELLHMDHSGTIASHTITLPAAPKDGQMVRIWSRSIITALTINAGAGESISAGSAITTIAAQGGVAYTFRISDNTWYRTA